MQMRKITGLATVLLFAFTLVQEAHGAPVVSDTGSTKAVPMVPPSAQTVYREAVEKLAADDLAGAERAFQRMLEEHPENGTALLGLAEIAFKLGQSERAEGYVLQAVGAEPTNAYAQAALGRLLATQRQFDAAEAALLRATLLDQALVRPRMDLADLYATVLRNPDEAVALYRSVVTLEPDHAGAYYALGVTLLRLGEQEQAVAALESAARLAPGNPLPHVALAQVAVLTGAPDHGVRSVERALEIQPNLAEALELRGDIRQIKGELDQALADYTAAIGAQPSRVSALLKQASLRQAMGDTTRAARDYLAALEINPDIALAYNNLAWMATEKNTELDQAERWARRAVELGPDVADFHDTLGWVLRARGMLQDAQQALERAIFLDPASAEIFYHLGVVHQELDRPDEAARAFNKSLEINRAHEPARRALESLGIPAGS
jgi:tetratricopeptide (TPR) repeat protein